MELPEVALQHALLQCKGEIIKKAEEYYRQSLAGVEINISDLIVKPMLFRGLNVRLEIK